jgi:hypothetical protein
MYCNLIQNLAKYSDPQVWDVVWGPSCWRLFQRIKLYESAHMHSIACTVSLYWKGYPINFPISPCPTHSFQPELQMGHIFLQECFKKKRINNWLPFCVLVCFQKKSCRSWCAFCQAPRWPKSNGNYSRWWEYTASLEKAHWPDGCNERATGCYITPCSCFHLAIPSMPLSLSMLIK